MSSCEKLPPDDKDQQKARNDDSDGNSSKAEIITEKLPCALRQAPAVAQGGGRKKDTSQSDENVNRHLDKQRGV